MTDSGQKIENKVLNNSHRDTLARLMNPVKGVISASVLSYLSMFVVMGGVVSSISTYLVISGLTPVTPTEWVFKLLIFINLLFVVPLVLFVFIGLIRLWKKRKIKQPGSHLNAKLVSMFSIIAVVPAILVAIFAFVTLDRGLDSWFSDRTKLIINNTALVANAYLDEHRATLRRDSVIMASDLSRAAGALEQDIAKFTTFLTAQAALRSIPMALLIDEDGKLITAAQTKRQIPIQPPPKEAFEAVNEGQPVIMTLGGQAQIRSLLKLDKFDGLYLYTAKKVDPQIVEHLAKTDIAMREYNSLESQRFEAQLTFALIYIGIALVLLLAAIWFGLGLANGLAFPIGQLIIASKRVSNGNLDTRVDIDGSDEDINRLGHTFNQMTEQLSKQREDLIDARDDLSRRHNFTEMVLTGISSGVIGLDEEGKINHANLLAQDICGVNEFNMVGRPIDDVLPAFSNLLIIADSKISRAVEIELKDDDGNRRVLLVRVAKGRAGNEKNYVITFEDVTNLISAQRTAAWADIARRIAHEIKNPLTPIQLSAERLKSKYEDEVSSDPEIFKQCTETIIRQVGDIGRMVDEFSSFARMPSVVFKNFDIKDAVSQTVFLQRVAHPEIEYIFECEEDGEMPINADSRLISQALTNILKNGAESIYRNQERVESKIVVTLRQEDEVISIDVADTGIGLPDINREALLEPYITTREQGTGLGLAIVKKVMSDHGGEITLGDAPWVRDGRSGAQITLSFPSIKRETVRHSKVEEVI